MKKNKISGIKPLTALFMSVIVLAPFYMILINSFKTKKEAAHMTFAFPTDWNIIQNYVEVFETGGLARAFLNSCFVTFLSVGLVILVSSLAAFVLQRRKTKFSKWVQAFFVVGLVIPGQIIPTYIICSTLHLTSFLGCALVLTASNLPLGVFMYLGYLKNIPYEIDEAAVIDGCSSLKLYRKIILPLVRPMTLTLFILTFMNIWNDFGTTIYFLNSGDNYTLPLTIYNFFSTHSSDWNLVFTDVIYVSLPVLAVYFCAQKHIMSGMTSGAVKG